ncbi:MAG: putative Ig domain-containing protein, partial [Pseudomonadota bacterium]
MGRILFYTTSPRLGAIVCLTLLVAACGGGGGGDDASDASKGGPTAQRQTAPTISGTPPSVTTAGQLYDFTPRASDADGDILSFSVENAPGWAAFDATTGRLNGTPGNTDIGSTSGIVLSVSDGTNTRSLPAFSIRVVDGGLINTAPEIGGQPAGAVVVGNSYSFVPDASDADGNALTFTVTNLPSWLSFDAATGAI